MKGLSITQMDIAELALEQIALKDASFKMEMLDHLCCLIEERMDNGHTFEEALKSSFQDLKDSDLIRIEKELLFNKKYKLMKNLILVTGVILLLSSTLLLSQIENVPVSRPLGKGYKISSNFGEQVHPILKVKRHHDGVDFVAPEGTPIYAPANGVVESAKTDKNKFGKNIMIKHDEKHKTFYSHLSEILVKDGQKVEKGELIGKVGNTGLSTAPHLHYEVIVDGEKVNPLAYFKKKE